MTYRLFKIITSAKPAFDNATTGGTDSSTDPVITKDPNDFLSPRADKFDLIQILIIIVLALVVAYLAVQIGKQS